MYKEKKKRTCKLMYRRKKKRTCTVNEQEMRRK